MKKIASITALILSLAVSSAYAQNEKMLNPGDDLPAMNTSMRNANGQPTTLKSAMKENGLLVMFSCNTCPYVVRNEPVTKKTMEYAAAHKVGMVIINSNEAKRDGDDSYNAMAGFAKEQQYSVPYLIDENSKLADLFGANHTPEVFLFNNKGKLMYKGAMNDNPSSPGEAKKMYVQDAIDAVVAGKEADPKITKSIGCSIKRKA
jgi:thioredoxin-related protein